MTEKTFPKYQLKFSPERKLRKSFVKIPPEITLGEQGDIILTLLIEYIILLLLLLYYIIYSFRILIHVNHLLGFCQKLLKVYRETFYLHF